MSFLAVHSFKGGTGKTSISVNLAAIMAASGKSACVLDWDFSGPSFRDVFDFTNKDVNYYLNDFIKGECEPQDALIDVSDELGTPGKYWIGFSSPEPSEMREIARKGRKWQMRALSKIFNLRKELVSLDVDLTIFDTSPGIHYSSINAIISSDIVIIVMKPYKPDFGGTRRMISAIHESLEKQSYLLINKAPVEVVMSPSDSSSLKSKVESVFEDTTKVELLGLIPCYCSVAQRFDTIIALDHEEHPFVSFLRSYLPKLMNSDDKTPRNFLGNNSPHTKSTAGSI